MKTSKTKKQIKAQLPRFKDAVQVFESEKSAIAQYVKDINYDAFIPTPNFNTIDLQEHKLVQFPQKKQKELNTICIAYNFSKLEIKNQYTHNFIEELKNKTDSYCILSQLKKLRDLLSTSGKLYIFPINEISKKVLEQFLSCSHFEIETYSSFVISAKKKPLISYTFSKDKLAFREVTEQSEIKNIQNFAAKKLENYNFSLEIDSIFNPNSVFYVVEKTETKEIVCFLRFTYHLPGYPLPLMLAEQPDGTHITLSNPETHLRGELFAPFFRSLSGLKGFKELIKNTFDRYFKDDFYEVFTTFDVKDEKSRELYVKGLGYADTGWKLNYGDFLGTWSVIKSQISMKENLRKFINA